MINSATWLYIQGNGTLKPKEVWKRDTIFYLSNSPHKFREYFFQSAGILFMCLQGTCGIKQETPSVVIQVMIHHTCKISVMKPLGAYGTRLISKLYQLMLFQWKNIILCPKYFQHFHKRQCVHYPTAIKYPPPAPFYYEVTFFLLFILELAGQWITEIQLQIMILER